MKFVLKCFGPNNDYKIVFTKFSFQFTMEHSKSVVLDNTEEIEVNMDQVKAMLQYLMEITPPGLFP